MPVSPELRLTEQFRRRVEALPWKPATTRVQASGSGVTMIARFDLTATHHARQRNSFPVARPHFAARFGLGSGAP